LEQRVKEIVRGGISLSSLFYTVGPTCLSSDEIFLAFEYRERLKLYEKEKKDKVRIRQDEGATRQSQRIFGPEKRELLDGRATSYSAVEAWP